MTISTDAPSEINDKINLLIGDLITVLDDHVENHIKGLPMRDGFFILTTALAERAAAVVMMANGVLEGHDDELIGIFNDTITSILETARSKG